MLRPSPAATLHVFEKYQQLIHRHAPAFIRYVLDAFRQHTRSAVQAAAQLGLSPSRLYALSTAYNTARARQQQPLWTPGASGGDHAPAWPQPVMDLLKKRLACSPPCPYSFAASEALRLHAFKLDRAQVRRWALANKLAHVVPPKKVRAAVRRWQRDQTGELWQLDASPHRWFPHSKLSFPMLNMLDDCSRLFTGSKLYERELLISYFDFLPAAFLAHGRPLQIYVDYHSIFFTHDPEALTQLGWALKFYDISFLYAPTPQAKGKVEREHQFWQGRLPAYFASEKITEIEIANPHIDDLRAHRNAQEVHRELRQTPQRAWDQARKEKRSVLRPARVVRGGIMCGASEASSKSAAMDACRSAPNACESKNHPKPRWCSVCIPQATTPCSPPHPIAGKNPCSSLPIVPNQHSGFANYKTFLF